MKFTLTLFISGLLMFSYVAHGQLMDIRTIAGTGVEGYSNDGHAATIAEMYGPLSPAVDKAGNVYFVDYFNDRVRKINTSGIITTVAGNGVAGFSGDNSIATSANIAPEAIALDKHGNMYISDPIYAVIRKVNTLGIITTIIGSGTHGYYGDNGPAKYAELNNQHGIAVDTFGNIFIADATNNVVRKVDTAGIITTVAGNDTAGYMGDYTLAIHAELDSPYAVAVDLTGNLYITDYKNNAIRKVDTTGIITTYVTSANLNEPAGIAVDTAGNLFIADANNSVIRKMTPSGAFSTVVGNGTAGFGGDLGNALGANLHTPFGVAVDVYGDIYIADANNERIRMAYDPFLAVSSVFTNNNLELYPNPSTDRITLTGLNKYDKIAVYDIVGKQVGASWEAIGDATQTFDIKWLTSGVYLLEVYDEAGNKKSVGRLVKE